jgi:hypothetical protein
MSVAKAVSHRDIGLYTIETRWAHLMWTPDLLT